MSQVVLELLIVSTLTPAPNTPTPHLPALHFPRAVVDLATEESDSLIAVVCMDTAESSLTSSARLLEVAPCVHYSSLLYALLKSVVCTA